MTTAVKSRPRTSSSQTAEVTKAKRLLKSAVRAVETLAEDVAELTRMRAWQVMGYPNFSDMWEAETGFSCPPPVKVMAVTAMANEGMVTRGRPRKDGTRSGLTPADIASAIGYGVYERDGKTTSPQVGVILYQYRNGVPVDLISAGSDHTRAQEVVRLHGRARSTKRPSLGAGPDDMISCSVNLRRRDRDSIRDIARKAGVPDSEIYRQAIAEYLARLNVGEVLP